MKNPLLFPIEDPKTTASLPCMKNVNCQLIVFCYQKGSLPSPYKINHHPHEGHTYENEIGNHFLASNSNGVNCNFCVTDDSFKLGNKIDPKNRHNVGI